jgi:hypothetical protein
MGIAKFFRVILMCLIPMSALSSCKHQKASKAVQLHSKAKCKRHKRLPAERLHSQAKKELIAGSATGVASVGAATTTGLLMAGAQGGSHVGSMACVGVASLGLLCFLPVAVITASVALTLIVKGVKHRRKAKMLAKLEGELSVR